MLAQGDKAPLSVPVVDESGTAVSLQDYSGSYVVVYFYPRDMTPGCTLEAIDFRERQQEFHDLNTIVVGVSKDTCASHKKFIEKKSLPFSLWSDPEHALMEAFGTWGERTFMGRRYMGTSRSTFLIDPKGVVVRVWENVKPLNHAGEVLNALREISQAAS